MKTKKTKTMPDGWVRVTWKDKSGIKWNDNIPKSTLKPFSETVKAKGGIILEKKI